jgi:hypothetical protein
MTPGAIRARKLREERTAAKVEAIGKVRQRGRREDAGLPRTQRKAKPADPERTPEHWSLMPSDAVERKRAKQIRQEKGGGHRVTPEGTSGIVKVTGNIREPKQLLPLNKFENAPTPRAMSTFEVLGLGGPKDQRSGVLADFVDEDGKRSILQDLKEALFTVSKDDDDGDFYCTLCDFHGWESHAISHLEDTIQSEIDSYRAAKKKQEDLYEGYERLAMHHGTTPISVAPVALGTHALYFLQEVRDRKRHKRKVRTTAKEVKMRTAQVIENTAEEPSAAL